MPGAEKLRDMAVDRHKPSLADRPEQLRAERVPQRGPIDIITVVQGDVLGVDLPLSEGVTGRASHELGRAEVTGCVEQLVAYWRAARQGVLVVVLCGHLAAGHVERIETALGPTRLRADHAGQHVEGLRVGEQRLDTALASPLHKGVRVIDSGLAAQDMLDVRRCERVEPQGRDHRTGSDGSKPGPVVLTQPVGLPARDTEGRVSKGIEAGADAVEGCAHVGRAGSHLVEAVDEKRLASPPWMLGGV